jgi:hypothetical protein
VWQKERPKQGIVFRDCRNCTITGVHVQGVTEHAAGLELDKCERMHVSDCTIFDCDHAGLLLRGVKHSAVHGCFIRDDRAEKPAFRALVNEGGEDNRVTE